MKRFLFLAVVLISSVLPAATLTVGPGKQYAKPSQASANAHDGDSVLIDGGDYPDDCTTWTRNNLTIIGVNGRPHLHNKICASKAIWNIDGSNTTIDNIEFSVAFYSVDKNGAGIRMEAPNLTIRHCYFHDSDEGILTNSDTTSTLLIEYSEFFNNGNNCSCGYAHNMYIGHLKEFTLHGCYVHGAHLGHNVKSRAHKTTIAYNRIMDEAVPGKDSTSRECDIPDCGDALIIGNVFEKSQNSQNSTFIGYGIESLTNPEKRIVIVNNTFVNDRQSGSIFIAVTAGTDSCAIVNNIFAGQGTVLSGTARIIDSSNNLVTSSIAAADLVNAAYDYHLLSVSPARDAGVQRDMIAGVSTLPTEEYFHPDSTVPRIQYFKRDIGAFEFFFANGVGDNEQRASMPSNQLEIFPIPASTNDAITIRNFSISGEVEIFNLYGQRVATVSAHGGSSAVWENHGLAAGVYVARGNGTLSTTVTRFVILK